jgi:hypothetical protein
MTRKPFHVPAPTLRLTVAEYEALPVGKPLDLHTDDIGRRWLELCWGGIRVREWRGIGPDGYLIDTYKPVIRIPAVSRLVPRQQVVA